MAGFIIRANTKAIAQKSLRNRQHAESVEVPKSRMGNSFDGKPGISNVQAVLSAEEITERSMIADC